MLFVRRCLCVDERKHESCILWYVLIFYLKNSYILVVVWEIDGHSRKHKYYNRDKYIQH